MSVEPVAPQPPSVPDGTPARDGVPRRLEAPEQHPSGLAIIGSKIGPAAPARSILARPRLVDWFGQHAHARLILLTAEAGYGKTTLLGEFANHTRDRVVWYRLERSDGDWITFLSYLVAALRDVWPAFGRPTEALLRNVAAMGSSREVVLYRANGRYPESLVIKDNVPTSGAVDSAERLVGGHPTALTC